MTTEELYTILVRKAFPRPYSSQLAMRHLELAAKEIRSNEHVYSVCPAFEYNEGISGHSLMIILTDRFLHLAEWDERHSKTQKIPLSQIAGCTYEEPALNLHFLHGNVALFVHRTAGTKLSGEVRSLLLHAENTADKADDQ